jgi:4-amino-4-deoxy-L-arabinose transferase-like glycosyltransferase
MNHKHRVIAAAVISLYVAVQCCVVMANRLPFESDSAAYYQCALDSMREGTYYPNPSSVTGDAILAPVYINTLIGLLSITASPVVIQLFNIVLNVCQLLMVFLIAKKMFGAASGIIAMALYALYLNNIGLDLFNYTELMFGVLVLLSMYLYLFSRKQLVWLASGIVLGLALGVRPTAYALYGGYLLMYIISVIRRNPNHRRMILVSAGLGIYIVAAGLLAERNIGSFVFTSTTGPANLVMSANPNASGVFDARGFADDSVYQAKKTFDEKGAYLKKKSMDYIAQHPMHFLSIIPRKLYATFISDDWAVSILLNSNEWNFARFIKMFQHPEDRRQFGALPPGYRIMFLLLNAYHQLLYMILMSLIVYQGWYHYKKRPNQEGVLLINSFMWGGLLMALLASVGSARYKYTLVISGLIVISPIISAAIDGFQRRLARGDRPGAGRE